MNIAILVGSYYPNYSAVGICAHNVSRELVKLGHDVTVICNKTRSTDKNMEFEGSQIRYIEYKDWDRKLKINDILKHSKDVNSGFLNSFRYKLLSIKLFLLRIKKWIKVVASKNSVDKELVNSYVKQCNKDFDILIPFVFPFETIISTNIINSKNNKSLIFPIIFDNFVENPNLHRLKINQKLKRKRHLNLYQNALNKCQKCFVIHNQKSFFLNNLDKEVLQKVEYIEHPLLIKPKLINKSKDNNNVAIYAGSFIKDYVQPDGLLKLIDKVLSKDDSWKFEFCVMGNDTAKIDKLYEKHPHNIINFGKVPFSEVEDKLSHANLFLSVSEFTGKQFSSKLFTYIAYGKPIIHLYYDDNDVNVKTFKKYPLFYPIKVGIKDFESSIKNLDFINQNIQNTISFDKISEIFTEALPEELVQKIIIASNSFKS